MTEQLSTDEQVDPTDRLVDKICVRCDCVRVVELFEMRCFQCGGLLRASPFDWHGRRTET